MPYRLQIRRFSLSPVALLTVLFWAAVNADSIQAERTDKGLVVLYDFNEADGDTVHDQSNAGAPLNLKITDPGAAQFSDGSLEIHNQTLVRSESPATKLFNATRQTGEVTIEAWFRSLSASQEGPARIVTLSKNGNERNFTLGQEYDRFDVRLRTTRTSTNGMPSVDTPRNSVTTNAVHVVYTHHRDGRTRIFLDGKLVTEKSIQGAFDNWDPSFHFGLTNELSSDRPWLGTFYLVAVFNRELSAQEVTQNYQAGPDALLSPELLAERQRRQQTEFFETKVAPLLARHCLECHDSATREGGLDLSRRRAALAGADSGKVIVPGHSAESPLWAAVKSGSMPAERPALTDEEAATLQTWIDQGATWSLEFIDPAVYVHDSAVTQNWIRRLTVPEYIETVRAAVDVDIQQEARDILPRDLRADGFSNTAYNLNVDLEHIQAYGQLAEIIVSRMDVNSFAQRFSRNRRFTDKDMGNLISNMGRWLLRGPVSDAELIAYRGISTTTASAGGSYEEAVGLIIEAMLQSPRFLYRVENQRGDGTPWPVSDYELASRISYTIWGGPPDEPLYKDAEAVRLHDRAVCLSHIDRMLQDPKAVRHSLRFCAEWLDLGRLDNLQPNKERFPEWNQQLAGDMREETLAFFEDVVWKQDRPLTDLLNAQVTYATPRLARHYGLATAKDSEDAQQQLTRFDLSEVVGRGGLLTHGSVLTVGGDEASMVSRGLFVLHDLLRGTVNDPPPCVDTTPIPTKEGLTQRGIAETRIANSNCGGCHSRFEPLAFGLEKFDGIGAYHDVDEYGNKLRDDGQVLFPGDAAPVSYKTSAELMNILASSDRVAECMTWKLSQFAVGRPLSAADASTVLKVHTAAQQGGGTYASLMKAIILSDLIQTTRTEAVVSN